MADNFAADPPSSDQPQPEQSPASLAHFGQPHEPAEQVIAAYEQRLAQLEQENQTLRQINAEQKNMLATQASQMAAWEARWTHLESSAGWALAQRLQHWRARLMPVGSVREQILEDWLRASRIRTWATVSQALARTGQEIGQQGRRLLWQLSLRLKPPATGQLIHVEPVPPRPPLSPRQVPVDIIICVHNALADLQRCLASVERHTSLPYTLILVDDGSEPETQSYLAGLARTRPATLLRNDEARGYTRAANQGLSQATADYIVLLNSDTIVTAGWLDRLVACAESNPRIGLVGPLSNTASWQSIPEVERDGDWAANPLPSGVTVDRMGQLVAGYSARLYPELPFLNGFCLLLKRQLLTEIGRFDEENFGAGYGEENDYALRARQAGWLLALADDVYIYHAQSRSYSSNRRKLLSERAGLALAQKHGSRVISQGLAVCRDSRVLSGLRARSRVMVEREAWLERGAANFKGRRLLFVLPVVNPGGGTNVIFDEAAAMRRMGVEAEIFNLVGHREAFEQNYGASDVPRRYGKREELVDLAGRYEAVVATASGSVEWLAPLAERPGQPVLAYYIQEFEPYMYPPGSQAYQDALASYSQLPNLVCFTKTDWTRQEVQAQTGVAAQTIGVSLNIDLFRPRPRAADSKGEQPLKIVAMVRPRPPYRQAGLTMEILRRASKHYGARVEIVIFGVNLADPEFAALPRDFAWHLAGIISQQQVANLMNQADILADFSSHQAMGLTALEAMACGAAVIVPARGGAVTFARHEENSLMVDTSSAEACWQALQRLIEDAELRRPLQQTALVDVCQYYPERPAFNILQTLFSRP